MHKHLSQFMQLKRMTFFGHLPCWSTSEVGLGVKVEEEENIASLDLFDWKPMFFHSSVSKLPFLESGM